MQSAQNAHCLSKIKSPFLPTRVSELRSLYKNHADYTNQTNNRHEQQQ